MGLLEEEGEDLALGPDVDAAGGLVEEEHGRIGHQQLADDDLLLVAAGQGGDRGSRPGGLDGDLVHPAPDAPGLRGPGDQASADHGAQTGEGEVAADAEQLDDAVALSVLGDEPEATGDALADSEPGDVLAVQQHLAGGHRVAAGERLHQLGPPGAHQAVEAHDLAGAYVDGDVVHHDPAGGEVRDGEVADGERDLTEVTRLLAEVVLRLPAGHPVHHPGQVDLARRLVRHQLAVAQHHRVVGDADRLLEVMGDVDDRDAVRGELPDDPEQHLDLARAEGRGRLVHDQDPGLGRQRPCDLDDLLLAHPEVGDQRLGRDLLLELAHQPRGDLGLVGVVDPAHPGVQLAAEEDVVAHVEVRAEVRLLVDDRDASLHRVDGVLQGDRLLVQHQLSAGGLLDAREDLHQCRLPGTVLPEEHGDLAGADLEVDTLERLGDAVRLGDPDSAQHHLADLGGACGGNLRGRRAHRVTSTVSGWICTGLAAGCGMPVSVTLTMPVKSSVAPGASFPPVPWATWSVTSAFSWSPTCW